MNSHFIDFIIENIFSKVIPIADTFFNQYDIRVAMRRSDISEAAIPLVCDYGLELSWVFYMLGNIYDAELNEKNRYGFFQTIAEEARHILALEYPKQAVFIAMMNAAEAWYKMNFPYKAAIIIEENGLSVVQRD
jgi:hypothetical protein